MNTLKIKKVLEGNNIEISSTSNSSRVRGWSNSTEGVRILPDVICTYSDVKWHGKWRTFVKQTGVYSVTYGNSTYIGNKKIVDKNKMLKKIFGILISSFGKENVTLDLQGRYTIHGKDEWSHGAHVIVGDLKLLDQKHF